LIHSACGGIGIAAINICRMIDATIYATVGNQEKAKYLVEEFGIPAEHIFGSRDSGFLPGLMRETKGRGVDVALNSLSGELLHATVSYFQLRCS
jgi:NADPH:quinone reductase-like Zn-dependent oxidoreductase